eukprot:6295443-Prymnesium_polylepis.1
MSLLNFNIRKESVGKIHMVYQLSLKLEKGTCILRRIMRREISVSLHWDEIVYPVGKVMISVYAGSDVVTVTRIGDYSANNDLNLLDWELGDLIILDFTNEGGSLPSLWGSNDLDKDIMGVQEISEISNIYNADYGGYHGGIIKFKMNHTSPSEYPAVFQAGTLTIRHARAARAPFYGLCNCISQTYNCGTTWKSPANLNYTLELFDGVETCQDYNYTYSEFDTLMRDRYRKRYGLNAIFHVHDYSTFASNGCGLFGAACTQTI